jgi:dihydrodipicolinate synthase/N-acetylneuraminate lyase
MESEQKSTLAHGVYAALSTPRRPNSLEADTAVLLDYVDRVASTGVDGLVLFGSTGEFVHFEVEERMRVATLAIKRSRVPVLVNVSHSALAGAVAIAGSAIEASASGLLLTPPYFYAYGEGQILEFYRQFLDQVGRDIPVYLYNLPMFLNPISSALARRLLQAYGFAGIKDSSGDWNSFEVLQSLRPQISFQLLIGNEILYLQGRSAGADGGISGVAAAVPELMVALDRAITGHDVSRAEALDRRLREFLEYLNRFPAPLAIKQAAAARGWGTTHLAVPIDEDIAADLIAFQAWFRQWLVKVLSECNQASAMRT